MGSIKTISLLQNKLENHINETIAKVDEIEEKLSSMEEAVPSGNQCILIFHR